MEMRIKKGGEETLNYEGKPDAMGRNKGKILVSKRGKERGMSEMKMKMSFMTDVERNNLG